jgi:hypothetical protein
LIDQAPELKEESAPPPPAPPAPAASPKPSKLESLAEQILQQLQRREQPHTDFSVSKLFAGVVQIVALAALFLAYLNRGSANAQTEVTLLFAIFLELLTIALLIMARQK